VPVRVRLTRYGGLSVGVIYVKWLSAGTVLAGLV
jgi:hypothetical protein